MTGDRVTDSLREQIVSRFEAKVDRESMPDHWLWTGFLHKGYGRFSANGRSVAAHRWSYEHFVGPIPDGLQIDHLCRITSCVNPAHLEPVTARENTIRAAVLKTRCPRGHPYDGANTYLTRKGGRVCRKCMAANKTRYAQRKRSLPLGDPRHGSETAYSYWHCRCEVCRKGNADVARVRYARRAAARAALGRPE